MGAQRRARAADPHRSGPLHKALSRGGSFGEATAEPVVLYAWLVRNLERLIEELEYHGVRAGRLTVWVAYKNGQVGRRPGRRCRSPATGSTSCSTPPGPASAGRGCPASPATADAPDRRATSPPARDCPLGLFDPPGDATAPRPSPGSSARSTPGTAGSPSAAPPRCRWPPSTATRPTNTTSATSGGRCASDMIDLCMCIGIALAWSELPTELIGRHGLERRVHERGGEREVRFLYRDRRPRLPVWRDGRLQVVRWGNGRGQSRFLPRTGWTWLSTIQDGDWRNLEADPGRHPRDARPGARRLVPRPPGDPRPARPRRARHRRRLHDLRAGQPLLPGHDPLEPRMPVLIEERI